MQLEVCGGLINLITFNFLPPETCSRNLGSILALGSWPVRAADALWAQLDLQHVHAQQEVPNSPGP